MLQEAAVHPDGKDSDWPRVHGQGAATELGLGVTFPAGG